MREWCVALFVLCSGAAQAGDLDYQSHGATVHRRAFVFPQCVRLSYHPLGWDWMLDPPCKPTDLATVEPGAHIHYRDGITKVELEQAIVVSVKTEHNGKRQNPTLTKPGCIRLPDKPPEKDLVQPLPCLTSDIGHIDAAGRLTFRPDVSVRELEYALTVALIIYDAVLATFKDWPEYRGDPVWPWPE